MDNIFSPTSVQSAPGQMPNINNNQPNYAKNKLITFLQSKKGIVTTAMVAIIVVGGGVLLSQFLASTKNMSSGVGDTQANQVSSEKTLVFATSELRPYIGETLQDQGYVHELLTEVAKRIGYTIDFKYVPPSRAKVLAEDGRVDGLAPSFYDKPDESIFAFSDPFPGDTIGLLKKKSLNIKLNGDPQTDLAKALEGLQKYRVGIVGGTDMLGLRAEDVFKKVDVATDDLANLDKLQAGRVDLVVIDKYTAADLMVQQRPQYIGQLEFVKSALVSKQFHVAFSKKSKGFEDKLAAFQAGLQEVKKDGTLDKILRKHGLLTNEASKRGKTRLSIGTVDNNDMVVMQELSREFEAENPDIELDWRVMDENTLRLRSLSDLSISDGKFDIMTIGAYEAPIWAKNGWIAPIKGLPRSYDIEDVLPAVRNALSYQGQLYALPFYAESSMLYYRKDLFAKAGLTMPDQPTYDDIKKFAAALHDPSKEMYGIGLRGKSGWGENMAFITQLVNTFGGRWFDQSWNPELSSTEWKNALSYYVDLLRNYGPPNASKNGFNENLELFRDGKTAMWIDATVAAGMLFDAKASKVADKVGFAPAPIAVTPKGSHWLWTWALAIPDSSTKKGAALKFIEWATSKEYIQQVAAKHGWVAVPPGTRKSTYENQSYKDAAPFSDFVLNAILTADPVNSTLKPKPYIGIQFVGIPEFPAIGGQVGDDMRDALDGRISVDEALSKAQNSTREQMKNSGYIK